MKPFTAFLIILAVPTEQSSTTNRPSAETQPTTNEQPIAQSTLACYTQLNGVLDGQTYSQSEYQTMCDPGVKYCQRIAAHYMGVKGETEILMKGCDTIRIFEDGFTGIPCRVDGCHEQSYNEELYHVCCCTTNYCNSTPSILTKQFKQIYILILFYLMS